MVVPGKRLRVSDGTARLTLLSGLADNTHSYNSASFSQQLASDGASQYATWVNDSRHPMVAQRTIPGDTWTVYDFSTNLPTTGASMGVTVPNDGHNVVNVAVDADGYVHVSGNMHGDWLRYARSTNPGDVTAFANQGMLIPYGTNKTGTDEGLVSYPRFIKHPDGTLFFHYRNGGSGNGDNYLNRYDTATQSWSRVAKLVDGTATNESAYENRPVFDTNGVLHYSFSWSPAGGGFNDRNDICYMRSSDKGATWEDIDGYPVTLPVTHPTAPVALDTTDSNNGVLNQFGMDVDDQGRPHMATLYVDGAGNRNIFHLWHDGTTWQMDPVTDFTSTGLDYNHIPSRPDMLCWGGRSFICWRHQYDGRRGHVWLSEVTDDTPAHFPVAEMDLYDWEPTHDQAALTNRDELHMIVTRRKVDAGRPGQEGVNFATQNLGVLTVDMTRIDSLRDGRSALPRLPKP